VIAALVLAAALGGDTSDTWLGRDKARHFLLSAFVHSVTFTATRAVAGRRAAQIAGGGAVIGIGLLKEIGDRRAGRHFSIRDLAWGVAGGVAAGALLNGTR
jgi:uncharacterized protein YfiM (DUF2279 family)